jgi:hypothetical protein
MLTRDKLSKSVPVAAVTKITADVLMGFLIMKVCPSYPDDGNVTDSSTLLVFVIKITLSVASAV